jgi:uroporphyrinogen-III decarboxylase
MHVGYFQNLMAFVGFENGLCAMNEEPEECLALFDFLADFYCEVADKSFDYYKPEFMGLTDDTATELNPFTSIDMFEELLMPAYRKQCAVSIKRGLPTEIHNCSRCEDQTLCELLR